MIPKAQQPLFNVASLVSVRLTAQDVFFSFSLGVSVLNACSLSQKGSSGWRGSSSGPCRGWQRGKAARGRRCIRLGYSGLVGELSRVGEASFGRGAWVEWKVQRDKKRGILVALCAVERVVPQPIGSDSSWPRGIGNMSVQVMPGFRPTSRCCRNLNYNASRRCATETVGFVLSCLSLDIFGLGRYRDFRERSSLASNLLDRLLDGTSLSINVSLHEYALRMDVLQCMSDHSALVQTSSPRKTACCTSKPSTQST